MKKILVALSIYVCSVSAFAQVGDTLSSATDCSLLNGRVVTLTPTYFTTNGDFTLGIAKEFCVVSKNSTVGIFGLDTISNESSIAATYVKLAKIVLNEGSNLPTKPYSNPSINVCKSMGGTTVDYTDPKRQVNGYIGSVLPKQPDYQDICTFGDGSSISGWTLIYSSIINGGVPDPAHQYIINSIKSKPLPINAPNLKY